MNEYLLELIQPNFIVKLTSSHTIILELLWRVYVESQFAAFRYNEQVFDLWGLDAYSSHDQLLDAVANITLDESAIVTSRPIDYNLTAVQGRRPEVPLMFVVLAARESYFIYTFFIH